MGAVPRHLLCFMAVQGKAVHFVTADVGGSGRLENDEKRVLAAPKVDTSTVLASKTSVFLEGEAITRQASVCKSRWTLKLHARVVSCLCARLRRVVAAFAAWQVAWPLARHLYWRHLPR